jgi:hypothetical protein
MSFRISVASLALLAALAGPAGAVNIVLNPGFETGDFTNWTTTGDGISVDSVFPNTGLYDAAFSALTTDANPGVLSQVLTTSPGKDYTIGFALLDEGGSSLNSFIVTLGAFSTTITGDQAGAPGTLPSGYTPFTFIAPGADILGSSTTLSFQGLQDPSISQDWNLDDVSVTANVPEPATWALLLAAFVGLALRRPVGGAVRGFAQEANDRRRFRKSSPLV